MLAHENFDGPYVWHNRRTLPQDAQKVRQLRSRIVQTLNVPQRVRLRAFTRCGLAETVKRN
jgi:hypothetical protein